MEMANGISKNKQVGFSQVELGDDGCSRRLSAEETVDDIAKSK